MKKYQNENKYSVILFEEDSENEDEKEIMLKKKITNLENNLNKQENTIIQKENTITQKEKENVELAPNWPIFLYCFNSRVLVSNGHCVVIPEYMLLQLANND